MPAIPTPFVGGAQAASTLESAPPSDWAPPYWPGPGRPRGTEDSPTESFSDLLAEPAHAAEPIEQETAAVDTIELIEPPAAATEAVENVFAEGVEAIEIESADHPMDDRPETAASSTQEIRTSEAAAERMAEDESEAVPEAEDQDYPDYLFGPDGFVDASSGGGPHVPADELGAPADPADADSAERPLEGEGTERIRRLAADLEGLSIEEMIARAYAEGYRAARGEDEAE